MNRWTVSVPLRAKQRGLTLVEMMVALALSLVLLAGVIQIYLSSKQTYNVHDAVSRLQENGRYAVDLLTRDLRMAGHIGCSSKQNKLTNTLNNAGDYAYTASTPTSMIRSSPPAAMSPPAALPIGPWW